MLAVREINTVLKQTNLPAPEDVRILSNIFASSTASCLPSTSRAPERLDYANAKPEVVHQPKDLLFSHLNARRKSSPSAARAQRLRASSVSAAFSANSSTGPSDSMSSHSTLSDRIGQRASQLGLRQEQEALCCFVLQEARRLAEAGSRQASIGQEAPGGIQEILSAASQALAFLVQAYKGYITQQARRLQSPNVRFEDMFLAGTQGLVEAAYRYKLPQQQQQHQQQAQQHQQAQQQDAQHPKQAAQSAAAKSTDAGSVAPQGPSKPEGSSGSGHAGGGARFLTYAHFYIRKSMLGAFKDASNQIYVPRYLLDIKKSVARAVSEARAELAAAQQAQQQQAAGAASQSPTASGALAKRGNKSQKVLQPSIEDVARRAGVSAKAVRDLLNATSLSLTALVEGGDDGEDAGFEDAQMMKALDMLNAATMDSADASGLPYEGLASARDQEAAAARWLAGGALEALMAGVLSQREAEVLRRSMGLGGADGDGPAGDTPPPRHADIAAELGISRQRVDQLSAAALRKMQGVAKGGGEAQQLLEELCASLAA